VLFAFFLVTNAFGFSSQLTKTSNGRVATNSFVVVVVAVLAFRVKVVKIIVVIITSHAIIVLFYGVQQHLFVVRIWTFLLVRITAERTAHLCGL
jgi:hypothetical protein